MDAQVDAQAARDGAANDAVLDAEVTSDAIVQREAGDEVPVDAAAPDTGFCVPSVQRPLECAAPSAPSVACGPSLVCSGATPICCERYFGAQTHDPNLCVASASECEGGDPYGGNVTSRCDDAQDCGLEETCRDGYNKGLGHRNGARCTPRCTASLSEWGGAFPWSYQLCAQTCECEAGYACLSGRCAPPENTAR